MRRCLRVPLELPSDRSCNTEVGLFRCPDAQDFHLQTDVGTLGLLPQEILYKVLHQLDVDSLTNLDRVSKGMRRAVGCLPKLRTILDKQERVIRAIWAARTGHLVTCSELYDRLCDPRCRLCDDAGIYLHLRNFWRLCHDCEAEFKEYSLEQARESPGQFKVQTVYDSVEFEWLDRSTQVVGYAVRCEACCNAGAPIRQCYYPELRSRAGYRDHVRLYGPVVRGKHVREPAALAE